LAKNRYLIIAIVAVFFIVAIGTLSTALLDSSNGLQLNLASESSTSSGEVVRYEINNRGSGAWTCDPGKFMIRLSDGTDAPGIPEVASMITIQSGGSASGLLLVNTSSQSITGVGLYYDDGIIILESP
jgi:hypothetical protein